MMRSDAGSSRSSASSGAERKDENIVEEVIEVSSASSGAEREDEIVKEVIEVEGRLLELPLDIGEALGDPRLSECFLLNLHKLIVHGNFAVVAEGAIEWEHKYRINVKRREKTATSKKDNTTTATTRQINNRMVLSVHKVRYQSHIINEEGVIRGNTPSNVDDDDAAETILTDTDEEVAKITLPATHLIIWDEDMPTQVMLKRVNVESIVTLALRPPLLPILSDQLLLAAPRQSLLHLLIYANRRSDVEVTMQRSCAEALVEKGLWLHLQGLALPSSLWNVVAGHILSSQGNKLTYLGIGHDDILILNMQLGEGRITRL